MPGWRDGNAQLMNVDRSIRRVQINSYSSYLEPHTASMRIIMKNHCRGFILADQAFEE